jgi:hypothetical protein
MTPKDMEELNKILRPMLKDAVEREVKTSLSARIVKDEYSYNNLEKKISSLESTVTNAVNILTVEVKSLRDSVLGNAEIGYAGLQKRMEAVEVRLQIIEDHCEEYKRMYPTLKSVVDGYNAWKIIAGFLGFTSIASLLVIVEQIIHFIKGI